jgi:AhpD family alkylhydroperoxidase
MRLDILNRGYGPGTKLLFALIRMFSGHPVPDAAKLVFYRPGFYGARAKKFTHEAMRGPSAWSVADRELMAAFVSKVNECAFCVGAHTATAGQAYQDGAKVQAVLAGLESAPVEDGLRATLRMLGKLTREGKGGRRGHAGSAVRRCLTPAGRGRAGGLRRVQHDRPARRRLRLRIAQPRGLRGRSQVPAQAGLPIALQPPRRHHRRTHLPGRRQPQGLSNAGGILDDYRRA